MRPKIRDVIFRVYTGIITKVSAPRPKQQDAILDMKSEVSFVVRRCITLLLGWSLLPLGSAGLSAQTARPVPPEVDAALRARVTEFLQIFVDKKYSKGLELVAEDTKDAYFGSAKSEIESFELGEIRYNEDFTKAVVETPVVRIWYLQSHPVKSEGPWRTSWKMEDGKWKYTYEVLQGTWTTPMGPTNTIQPAHNDEKGRPVLPAKIDAAALAGAVSNIRNQLKSSTDAVTFSAKQGGTQRVTIHSDAPGSVSLEIAALSIKGLSAKLDKLALEQGGEATLEVSFSAGSPKPSGPVLLEVLTSPLPSQLGIQVRFND